MIIGNYFKNLKPELKKHFFSGINFNSKNIKKNNIFFAIKGTKIDGTKHIHDAVKKGAKTIVSKIKFEGIKENILYINSKNVRKSLARIAYSIHKNKPKNLVAVTGTNGKSSIAEFYFQILKFNKKKVSSIGTLGIKKNKTKINISNTTLDPISLSKVLEKLKKEKVDNVILEASSHGLKQNRLDGLKFDTTIFTNLSHDHLDYHKNLDDYLESKLYLFKKLLKKNGNLITDKDIPEYKKIKNISLKKKINLFNISNSTASLQLISHSFNNEKQLINIRYKKKIYKTNVNLIGKIQIKNLMMAMIAAEKSNLNFNNIINVINKIEPVSGRFEKIGKIKNRSKVILDYAHTPDALKTCIENIKTQFMNKKISLVFGCGGDRDKTKRKKMGKIANDLCDKIYLTDDNPRSENPKKIRIEVKRQIKKSKIEEIPDRARAIEIGIQNLKMGEVLIVAGKGHENIQDYGLKKNFFSDKQIILRNIKIKNKRLSKDLRVNILKEKNDQNYLLFNNLKIKKASIDSKEIKKDDMFFAIKGKNTDGHLYLNEAFKKKASLAIVKKIDKRLKKFKQIKVDNVLNFLTECSSKLRDNLSSNIIGITGSCGKTSLKELLGKTLLKFSKVTYSKKSHNNKFGVPLSLFNLKQNDDYGIFEIGMDKKGEIDYLSNIIKPDVGVITNISYAHAKNFNDIKQIALAKAEIIKNIKKNGILILNSDDSFFNLHKKIASKNNLKVFSFGIKNKNSNIRLNKIVKEKNKFKLIIKINEKQIYFYIPNNYENHIKNILATITIMSLYINVIKLDKNIFYNIKTPVGRGDISKIKVNKKNIFLIDESYNSNPLSLTSAIHNFDKIGTKKSKKHLILGDMLELGKHSKKLHFDISKIINNSSINNVNVIGHHVLETYKNILKNKKGKILKKKSQIIDLIKNDLNNNDYLMIKGSNSTGLNEITNIIKTKRTNAI
jgi:MurE/MurF fusion protein